MPNIKTRSVADKTIKAINKAAVASERMKETYIRTKDKGEHGLYAEEDSPGEYASDRVSSGVENTTREAVYQFNKQGRKGVKTTKENISKVKEKIQKRKAAAEQPKKQAEKQVTNRLSEPIKTIRQERGAVKTLERGRKSIKTVDRSCKIIKQVPSTAKGTVKTASKSIQTAKKTVKTTQHAVKATIAAVKAIIAATKALIAAIAAGGWVAVLVIVVVCFVSMILSSCFGIFFSGEDSGTGQTIQTAIQEINTDFQTELNQIKTSYTYDVLEMSGSRAAWKEVLAVYAVKTTTDSDAVQEVVTIDDSRKQLLKGIFWQMNEISSSTSTQTETIIETSDDGNGNIVETEVTVPRTYLYITVNHKAAEEMAEYYAFNAQQKEYLSLLLSPENDPLWAELLGGFSDHGGQVIVPNTNWEGTSIFQWPLPQSFTITSRFGYRTDPITGEIAYHNGTDIAAPAGTPILAAADGTVTIANAIDPWGSGYGYHIKVNHGDTFDTLYAHCSSICVTAGQEVKQGEVIGYVGTTGNSTGNHLHFEVWQNGQRTDALRFFKAKE